MTTGPRTVTLPTLDHGDVTVPEPTWCTGHADHRPVDRVDLNHSGTEAQLAHQGNTLWTALLSQYPYATDPADRHTGLYVAQGGFALTLDPAGLSSLATALDAHADSLRRLAVELAALREGDQ
jgi:hypothetical protein